MFRSTNEIHIQDNISFIFSRFHKKHEQPMLLSDIGLVYKKYKNTYMYPGAHALKHNIIVSNKDQSHLEQKVQPHLGHSNYLLAY